MKEGLARLQPLGPIFCSLGGTLYVLPVGAHSSLQKQFDLWPSNWLTLPATLFAVGLVLAVLKKKEKTVMGDEPERHSQVIGYDIEGIDVLKMERNKAINLPFGRLRNIRDATLIDNENEMRGASSEDADDRDSSDRQAPGPQDPPRE